MDRLDIAHEQERADALARRRVAAEDARTQGHIDAEEYEEIVRTIAVDEDRLAFGHGAMRVDYRERVSQTPDLPRWRRVKSRLSHLRKSRRSATTRASISRGT
jgi:hypothetical protein